MLATFAHPFCVHAACSTVSRTCCKLFMIKLH
jgi:hypothetical protein